MIDRMIEKTIKAKEGQTLIVYNLNHVRCVQLVDELGFIIKEFVPKINDNQNKVVGEFIKKYQFKERKAK